MIFCSLDAFIKFNDKMKSVVATSDLHYSWIFIDLDTIEGTFTRSFLSNSIDDVKTWARSIVKYCKQLRAEYFMIVDGKVKKASNQMMYELSTKILSGGN